MCSEKVGCTAKTFFWVKKLINAEVIVDAVTVFGLYLNRPLSVFKHESHNCYHVVCRCALRKWDAQPRHFELKNSSMLRLLSMLWQFPVCISTGLSLFSNITVTMLCSDVLWKSGMHNQDWSSFTDGDVFQQLFSPKCTGLSNFSLNWMSAIAFALV